MPNFRELSLTHPWITIGVIVAALAGYSYMFFSDRRRAVRLQAAKPVEVAREVGPRFSELTARQRLVKGGTITLVIPGGFSSLLLLIGVFGGRYQRDGDITTDFFTLSELYLLGSIFLGAAIGLGAPFMRGLVRASLVGMVAIAPLLLGVAWSMDSGNWHAFDTVFVGLMTVILGIAIGRGAMREERRARREELDV